MKGIILAGGSGSRLLPLTKFICKQLLPVYNKPMIYYPLYTLMEANIKEILIISTPKDINNFISLFGNGNELGLSIEYATQASPRGIGEAFIIGEEFIGKDPVTLILGDNIFFGHNLCKLLQKSTLSISGATILGYEVDNPCDFGIAEIDENNNIISLKEKPKVTKSNLAIPGLYFYDNDVISISKTMRPSSRNELEITDINNEYLKMNKLKIEVLDNDVTWFDTGTHDNLLAASNFVQSMKLNYNVDVGDIFKFNTSSKNGGFHE